MIRKINIKTKNNIYSILIENKSIIKNLNKIINKKKKLIFLIDRKVFYVFKKLKNYKNKNYIIVDCSEKIKSFESYSKLCEKILKRFVPINLLTDIKSIFVEMHTLDEELDIAGENKTAKQMKNTKTKKEETTYNQTKQRHQQKTRTNNNNIYT